MNPHFHTTSWTVIIDSASKDSVESRPALEALCRTYWDPLYSYVRSTGQNHEDAQDITQTFFSHLLEKNLPGHADPELGRFRTYLLGSLRNFMIDHHRHNTTQKRGGPAALHTLSLDSGDIPDPRSSGDTPEAAYERKWAHTLIGLAVDALAEEQAKAGHADRFNILRPLLLDPHGREIAISELISTHDMTHGHIRVLISRLRSRFRELVRQEVSRIVADASEIDAEIAHLLRAMQ